MDTIWPYMIMAVFVMVGGEIGILAGAGAASAGLLHLPAVFVVAVLGNILSDVSWYFLGYYGRIDWLVRRMNWVGVTTQKLDMLISKIEIDVIKLLIFAKLTNWMTIPALIATGVARVTWRRWFILILVSDFLIAVILVPLGYYMTASFLQIQKGVGYASMGFTLLFIIVAFFYIREKLSHKDRSEKLKGLDK